MICAFENIQSVNTPQAWLNPPMSRNFVNPGSHYNGSGNFSLAVVPGAEYIWTGTGSESCLNNATPVVSGVPFIAQTGSILLSGDANDNVFATVVRFYR